MKIEQFTPTAGRIIIKKTRELTKIVEVERPDYDNAIVENPERQDKNDLLALFLKYQTSPSYLITEIEGYCR